MNGYDHSTSFSDAFSFPLSQAIRLRFLDRMAKLDLPMAPLQDPWALVA